MKRKENERFEAYKKRRIQDRLVQETMLNGVFTPKGNAHPVYASVEYAKLKYQRLLQKFNRRKGVPA
jgi:hypothetical protein